jgi:solute carrier family 25 phosphate transporter 23/24/25/41
MKVPDMVTEIKMDVVESQNQRDARVESLWRKLDYQNKGELDWKGLQKGLRRIDHRQLPWPWIPPLLCRNV